MLPDDLRPRVDPPQPARVDPPPALPPPERNQVTHPVQPGENLDQLSARYQVPQDDIMQANPQIAAPGEIAADRNLAIPLADGQALPARALVQSGQTVEDIASSNHVTPEQLRQANGLAPTQVAYPGDQLWVPGAGPSVGGGAQAPAALTRQAPLSPEAQRVDDAVTRYESAVYARGALTHSPPDVQQTLQNNVGSAEGNLRSAVDAELDARAAGATTPPSDATLQQWGQDIGARYAGSPARQAQLDGVVTQIRTERTASANLAAAQQGTDPKDQLHRFSQHYAAATPEVRAQMLRDPQGALILDNAARWANEPLTNRDDSAVSPQGWSAQAMQRLDQATDGVDRDLAADVVTRALPGWESFNRDYQQNSGSSMLAMQGTHDLMRVADRIGGTPAGDAANDRFARTAAWDRNGVTSALAEGTGTAYVAAFIRANGQDPGTVDNVLQTAEEGMQMFQSKVSDDITDYANETEELHWLTQNHASAMTPEQLQQAITDYQHEKGADWTGRVRGMEAQISRDGEAILNQIAGLQNVPPAARGKVEDLSMRQLNSPVGEAASTQALLQKPGLVNQSPYNQDLKDFFSGAKVTNELRKLSADGISNGLTKVSANFANAWVKDTAYARVSELDPNKPATVTAARDALESLKDSRLARIMGVDPVKLNNAIDLTRATLPVKGESVTSVANKLTALDDALSRLDIGQAPNAPGGFGAGRLAGSALRGLGVLGATSSFLNSTLRMTDDPNAFNAIKLFADSASLVKTGAEVAQAASLAPDSSLAGRLAGDGAKKIVGIIGAVGDTALAVNAAINGDPTAAGLYGVTAAGGGLVAASAFAGAAAWTGPVGIGLIIVGTVGNAIWGNVKESNKHDNDTSARFLDHSDLDAAASKALVDQSGEGLSPVPLLMKYGEYKGLSPQQTSAWLNGLSGDQLATLRDRVHNTLDAYDGDLGRFARATPEMQRAIDQVRAYRTPDGDPDYYTRQLMPQSELEMDAMLQGLNIPGPR